MQQNIDLNIENYDLDDLLNLFHLKYNFGENDLKKAKKIVLKLHPDKSGLDKQYFLFFCKAYRMLGTIHKHRYKVFDPNTEYVAEVDKQNQLLIDGLLKKNNAEFNNWFNEAFEKINIVDEERSTGYGDWIKSDDGVDDTGVCVKNKDAMHRQIEQKKQMLSAIVSKREIEDYYTGIGAGTSCRNIDGSAPELYSSEIFSKLKYDDVKRAHTETVVPVCDADYNNIPKFANLESYNRYRNSHNIKPITNNKANNYLNNKKDNDDKININIAYNLAKQDEQMESANKSWWSNLRLLQ